jgi:hypothetical protein
MRDELLSIWPQDGIRTIVDLGCRDCWHTAGLPGVTRHVGVEIWAEALDRGRLKAAAGGIPHFEPVHDNALAYLRGCPAAAFDGVLAIDLLEHLEKRDGLDMLDEMERVAGRLAVAWTTLGYIQQGPYDVDGQFNPFEEHKWGPTPQIFVERGWQVRSFPLWHENRGGAILTWMFME